MSNFIANVQEYPTKNMSESPSSSSGSPRTPLSGTPSTPDISAASGSSSRSTISVNSGKFVPKGHAISKTITFTFRERQDTTGYSWKEVSQSTRDFYWHEFVKVYQWNPADNAIIKRTWNKVTSSLYNKKLYVWRKGPAKPGWIRQDVWVSWNAYWSSDKWLEKSRITTQNRCSETGGPGTGPSKHTGGSRSAMEHTIQMAADLRRPANSWDLFKKIHRRKDNTFVDARSKSIHKQMEAALAAAAMDSSDELQENEVNRLYLEIVGGTKKQRVYGLGSQALALYSDLNYTTSCATGVQDHAGEERIRLLEEEVVRMRENQEMIIQQRLEQEVQQRVEHEVQQRVEQEVLRFKQESDDRFRAMESMISDMALSRPSTHPR